MDTPLAPLESLTTRLKDRARELGFALVGVCPAVAPPGLSRLHDWLAAGFSGEMDYFTRRAEAYSHPDHVLAGAQSLLMLGFPYRTVEPQSTAAGQGRVSRYAWGDDYHDVLRPRLNQLVELLATSGTDIAARGVVDTAPLLEGEFAQLAGLGWIGKNTLLLNRSQGSWFFLAAVITNAELVYDTPHVADHCGTCRACLDACPTGAFAAPYVLDARRCISYLTIELRTSIPTELRSGLGDWLQGCDVCQEVCPWNHRAPTTDEPLLVPRPEMNPVDLASLLELDEAAFRARFRGSPLWRPKRRGLLRNAAILLGNRPVAAALPALVRGLHDVEPLVRGACAWALGRYAGLAARTALLTRQSIEDDSEVLAEIAAALNDRRSSFGQRDKSDG